MCQLIKSLESLGAVGILTEADLPGLSSQRRRVFELMSDGDWHTGPEIIRKARGHEGLRRLRELRDIKGVRVERDRITGTRTFKYRLIRDEKFHAVQKARAALA